MPPPDPETLMLIGVKMLVGVKPIIRVLNGILRNIQVDPGGASLFYLCRLQLSVHVNTNQTYK